MSLKKLNESNLIKVGFICFLIGAVGAGLVSRLFPEKITTKMFIVRGTYHFGQEVHRIFSPTKTIMYDERTNQFIPLNEYLEQIPDELGRRDIVKKMINQKKYLPILKDEMSESESEEEPDKESFSYNFCTQKF